MITKLPQIILFWFLLGAFDSFSQTDHYDTLKATKFLKKQLPKGYRWQLLSDESDYTYFNSKREFNSLHRLKVIPVYDVLKINSSAYHLKANYSEYKAFIFKGAQYLDIITALDVKLIGGKRVIVVGPDGYSNSKLYLADKMGGLFYYDKTNRAYRILKEDGLTYSWDYETGEFFLDPNKK